MPCKNICIHYKAQRHPNGKRYFSGQKRCMACEIYLSWEGTRCPCCSSKLRTVPRKKEQKTVLCKDKTPIP